MRLEGQSKLGYYPTPDTQLPLIASWLERCSVSPLAGGDLVRIADPCCGKGEALAYLARSLGRIETYGIELSYSRADEAEKLLNHVLATGFENALLTDGTFSLCLANPPYDGEGATGGGERLEGRFLLSTTPLLCEGGVLVYIIPEGRVDEKIARHLAGWYSDLRCFRFTAPDYQAFHQVVIFGRKKAYRQPTQEAVAEIRHWAQGQIVIEYEGRLVPLTDDEILLVHLEKAIGKKPDDLALANRIITHVSGDAPSKQNSDDAALVWVMRANAWIVQKAAKLLEEEAERPTKKVRVPVLADLSEIPVGYSAYLIPPSPLSGPRGQAFRFKHVPVTEEDYLRAAEKGARMLEKSNAWLNLIPEVEAQTITPVITPKQGHISMLVTAGLLGTTLVTHNGQPLLLKGGTEKYTVRVDEESQDEEEIEYDPDDPQKKKSLFRVRVEERSRPTLWTLDANGSFTFSNDPNAISDTLRVHVNELAQRVLGRNVPRYDLKPQPWEWKVFDPLSIGRYLPGRRETGLTEFQKHLSVGLGRLLLGTGSGLINAEMGAGKSCMSLAVAEYITAAKAHKGSQKSAYPLLVVAPGVATGEQNWPKETREVIPGGTPKVIEAAARPLPKPAKVVDWLKTIGVHINSQDAFEGMSAKQAWKAIIETATKQGKLTGADHRQARYALWRTLQQAEQRPPRKRDGADKPNLLDTRIGGLTWLGLGELPCDKDHAAEMRRRYTLAQFVDEYRAGILPKKSVAILSYETAKLGSGRVPAMITRKWKITWKEGEETASKIIDACACPHCGQVVTGEYDEEGNPVPWEIITPAKAGQFIGAKRRYCQAPAPKWVWNPETGQHEWRDMDDEGNKLVCGAPLFEYSELRREAAARYVQRKAKGFFPLLAVDEIHEARAQDTGNGWALGVLANSSLYSLGLTGTLFSGYSTSIFWLMYRLSSLVRRDFGFHDANDWARRYGLLRYTFYVAKPGDVLEDGTYTGAKFMNRVDERPGILPSIIRVGLPKIAFASLQDIGLPLPQYNEEVVWLQMSGAMADQYHEQADGSMLGKPYPPSSMYDWAIEEMKAGTKGALSVWLATALNRVNCMFRSERVMFNRRVAGKGKYATRRQELVKELDALGDGFVSSKDEWLASRCLAERQEGRKVIVFIRQTGKRDIQPHVAQVLQEHGLRVAVLSPSVDPRRRVAWIEKHIPGMDVLLTNARLVRVGLNLRMFATAIFAEVEWSLATLWQAMRRVYRPGSPLPVRVLFPTYENTLEERAINLMGQKMRAAQLFYGDTIASALCDEEDGDFLNDLILSVLKGEQIERATSIFATQNDMTASPLGSPTAISPRLLPFDTHTWAEWLAMRNQAADAERGQRRKGQDIAGQMSLFG